MLYSKAAKDYLESTIAESNAMVKTALDNIRKELGEGVNKSTIPYHTHISQNKSASIGIEVVREVVNKYGIKGMSVNNFKKIKTEILEKFSRLRDHTFVSQYSSSPYFLQYPVHSYISNRYESHIHPFEPFILSPLFGKAQTVTKEPAFISTVLDPTERNIRYIKMVDDFLRKNHRNLQIRATYFPIPRGENKLTLLQNYSYGAMHESINCIANLHFDSTEYAEYMGRMANVAGQAIAHSITTNAVANINAYYGGYSYHHMPNIKKLLEKTVNDSYQTSMTTLQRRNGGVKTLEHEEAKKVLEIQTSLIPMMLSLSTLNVGSAYFDGLLQIMKNGKNTQQKTREMAALEAVGRTNNYLASILRDGFDLGIVCQLINSDCISSRVPNGPYSVIPFKEKAVKDLKVIETYGISEITSDIPLDKIFKHIFGKTFIESFAPTEEAAKILKQTGINNLPNRSSFESWVITAPLNKEAFEKPLNTAIRIVSSLMRMGTEAAMSRMGR